MYVYSEVSLWEFSGTLLAGKSALDCPFATKRGKVKAEIDVRLMQQSVGYRIGGGTILSSTSSDKIA